MSLTCFDDIPLNNAGSLFLLKYNAILLFLESLKEWFIFHALSYVLKRRQDIFFYF